MPGGPNDPPIAGKRRKKPLPGQGLILRVSIAPLLLVERFCRAIGPFLTSLLYILAIFKFSGFITVQYYASGVYAIFVYLCDVDVAYQRLNHWT